MCFLAYNYVIKIFKKNTTPRNYSKKFYVKNKRDGWCHPM